MLIEKTLFLTCVVRACCYIYIKYVFDLIKGPKDN